MTSEIKKDLISILKNNFDIRELVCEAVYKKWGERSWMFLQTDLLCVISELRNSLLKVPMIVNTWASGGKFDERGLRCNLCEIPKMNAEFGILYLSPHTMGAAIDFHTKEYSAQEIREMIRDHWSRNPQLPNIRLEEIVSWVHIDVFDDGKGNHVTMFKG